MRSRPTTIRGPICLVRAGSGTVVGVAQIVDSLPPLSPDEYMDHYHRHAVPEGELPKVLQQKWLYPWVLANVRNLEHPVPYRHKGGVTFATLEPEVVRAVAEQIGECSTLPEESEEGSLHSGFNRCVATPHDGYTNAATIRFPARTSRIAT